MDATRGTRRQDRRELVVSFADGTRRIVADERNDAAGLARLDREAFGWLSRTSVLSAEVGLPAGRTATSGRGGYR